VGRAGGPFHRGSKLTWQNGMILQAVSLCILLCKCNLCASSGIVNWTTAVPVRASLLL
jgi:hypothetical protein